MNNQDKLISIGMPVYNGERFIRQALDSLLSQTYQNFELNISDNTSTDKTGAIGKEYALRDKRIRYYRNEQNIGVGNFKRVLDLAKGEYFMWTAHDDVWHEDFIAKLVAGLEANGDCDMAAANAQNINIVGEIISRNPSLEKFADANHLSALVNFLREPEIYGKANLVYGLYRTAFLRQMYGLGIAMNVHDWGTDCIFLFGCLCRTNLYVCEDYLFSKRDTRTVVQVPMLIDRFPDDYTFPPFNRVDEYAKGFITVAKGTIYEELARVIMNLRKDLYLKNRTGKLGRVRKIFFHLFSAWGWKNFLYKAKLIWAQPGWKNKVDKIKELFNNY